MNKLMTYLIMLLTVSGCENKAETNNSQIVSDQIKVDPCAIALITHKGTDRVDVEIIRRQKQVKSARDAVPYLERLGWAYVNKARTSFDPGYYHLAEQTALCIDSRQKNRAESLLLRGHVQHNIHQFKQAEQTARQLTRQRGLWFDYGLLGDALMEQGKLNEAVDAYQLMMDQRPGPQAYSRAAHMRWLKGDLQGAIEMMRKASRSTDPRTPEAAAWANVRLAQYRFQERNFTNAANHYSTALQRLPDYAPALLGQGRLLLAQGNIEAAVESLAKAANLNPLPEYQWALIDALRLTGHDKRAKRVETKLMQHGETEDPRTYALFLATTNKDSEVALRLAEKELENRADVFTLDTVAWALNSTGQHEQAYTYIKKALREGTQDARLFFHAGVIAHANGDHLKALDWFKKLLPFKHMLLPSEQDRFDREIVAFNRTGQLSSSAWM